LPNERDELVGRRWFWLTGNNVGATPASAVLLLALLALVIVKYVSNRVSETPNTAMLLKEGDCMKQRAKLWFAAGLETIHGLGANCWVSYLLTKAT
jgi:hypothetical protein